MYSSYARVYDRIFGRVFQQGREAAIQGLRILPGHRILEVGVGTGLCLPLYPPDCSIVAADVSASMLERARERVRANRLRHIELVQMDGGSMPFRDDSFDLVVAAYVVTAVPDHRKLMDEMIRVCRPDGRLVMVNHFANGNRLLRSIERAISPLCERIGFRTDLSLSHVMDGHPVMIQRHERIRPMGMWHLVECVNQKNGERP